MALVKFDHVNVRTANVVVMSAFYTEVLGLEQLPRPDFGFPGAWLCSEGQQIHLMQVEKHEAPEGQHFAFRIDDMDESIAELQGRGVKIKGPFDIPGSKARQAFLRDPSGNLIELNQPE